MQYNRSSTAGSSSSSSLSFSAAGITDVDRDLDAPAPTDSARFATGALMTAWARGDVFLLLPVAGATGTLKVEEDAVGVGVALPSFFAALGFGFGFALGFAGAFLVAAYEQSIELLHPKDMNSPSTRPPSFSRPPRHQCPQPSLMCGQ